MSHSHGRYRSPIRGGGGGTDPTAAVIPLNYRAVSHTPVIYHISTSSSSSTKFIRFPLKQSKNPRGASLQRAAFAKKRASGEMETGRLLSLKGDLSPDCLPSGQVTGDSVWYPPRCPSTSLHSPTRSKLTGSSIDAQGGREGGERSSPERVLKRLSRLCKRRAVIGHDEYSPSN